MMAARNFNTSSVTEEKEETKSSEEITPTIRPVPAPEIKLRNGESFFRSDPTYDDKEKRYDKTNKILPLSQSQPSTNQRNERHLLLLLQRDLFATYALKSVKLKEA